MERVPGSFRRHHLVAWIFTFALAAAAHAQVQVKVPPSWWPDPATGLMWTGAPVTGGDTHHADSIAACAALSVQGFSGWALPTLDQFKAVIAPSQVTTYEVDQEMRDGVPHYHVNLNRPDGTKTVYYLKFLPGFGGRFWTNTVGRVPQDFWMTQFPDDFVSIDNRSFRGISTFCVRPMEPDLATLAKHSGVAGPVASMAELRSIPTLIKSEEAIRADDFTGAQLLAEQGIAIAKSARALDDLAFVYSYLGQWDAAVSSMEAAVALNKDAYRNRLQQFRNLKKAATKDPNVSPAWKLLHDAGVALDRKDYIAAADDARQVTVLEPKWADGFRDLGLADLQLRSFAEASTALQKAVKLNSSWSDDLAADIKQAKAGAKAAAAP